MSEPNKALIRRLIDEFWNGADESVVDELLTEDHVQHDPSAPFEVRGPDGFKRFARMYRDAFPDLHYTVDDLVAEGDTVVMRWHASGTHTADLPGIPATGRRASSEGITIARIRDGRFTESWVVWDTLGMLRKLGVMPEPVVAAA